MKVLLSSCAVIALWVGFAGCVAAQTAVVEVKDSPIHTIPPEAASGPPTMTLAQAMAVIAAHDAAAASVQASAQTAAAPAGAPAPAPAALVAVAAADPAPAVAPAVAAPPAAAPVAADAAAPAPQVMAMAAPAPAVVAPAAAAAPAADQGAAIQSAAVQAASEPSSTVAPPLSSPASASVPGPAPVAVASAAPPPTSSPAVAAAASDTALSADEHAFFAALGHRVTDAATAYAGYVREASAIDPGFRDPDAVQHALRVGAAYHPDQLQQGLVAYAALLALRNPAFVDGVRAQAGSGLAERLVGSPLSVMQIAGAREAAADMMGVLRAHGVALEASGKAINQAAYEVQHQAWSKEPVADPVGVLAAAKASAVLMRVADEGSEKALLLSLAAAPHRPAVLGEAPPPQVVRGLTVAALAILGRGGDREDQMIEVLLRDSFMGDCLKLARMNLNQCLAAAGPHYDDVFCAGEHAVGETARCVSSVAAGGGGTLPAAIRPAAAPAYAREEAAGYGYPAATQMVAAPVSPAPATEDRWTEHDPQDADAAAPSGYGQVPDYGAAPPRAD